jgi:hypothetical protein
VPLRHSVLWQGTVLAIPAMLIQLGGNFHPVIRTVARQNTGCSRAKLGGHCGTQYQEQRRMQVVFTLLLVCLTTVTAIECQNHAGPFTSESAVPLGHHQGTSPYAASGSFCLIAILPVGMLHIVLLSSWVTANPPLLHSSPFVSRPFIPPRTAVPQPHMS